MRTAEDDAIEFVARVGLSMAGTALFWLAVALTYLMVNNPRPGQEFGKAAVLAAIVIFGGGSTIAFHAAIRGLKRP